MLSVVDKATIRPWPRILAETAFFCSSSNYLVLRFFSLVLEEYTHYKVLVSWSNLILGGLLLCFFSKPEDDVLSFYRGKLIYQQSTATRPRRSKLNLD